MFPPDDPTMPQTSGPSADGLPPPNPMVTVEMSDEDQVKWKGDIDRANKRRQVFEPAWERNLKAYTPDPTNAKWGDEVNPGIDFYQTEQKKALLFFETPTVILSAEEEAQQLAPQIAAHQSKLNQRLGRKGLDCERLMDKVMFSIICPAGMGCTKIGVTRITKDVPLLHPPDHPDPTMAGQPQMDPQGQPITAPVPVYQKIFWEHFSEKKALIPTNFHDTEFDKAPWMGMKFQIPTRLAIREYGLPADFKGKKTQINDQVFALPGVDNNDTDDDMTSGTELFYKASLYDDNVYHPDHLRQLVFVDGQDAPVVHRDSPYQTFQNGVYQPDDPMNMVGNPIHVFTIRDLVDSSYIPSDCTITRPLVNELSRFRTQLIEMRDSSTSIRICDEKVITPEILAKVVRGPFGSIIPVADYDPNRAPIMEIAHPVYSRDNFTSQDVIERDLTKVNTISANQTGAQTDTTRSATEIQTVQRNADVRMEKERNRFLAGFIAGVAKVDALIKRFETPQGQQPISGYSYDIKPDSGMHVDAASDRKFAVDRLNILLKEPHINVDYLLRELAPKLMLDPTQLIVQPQPPKPAPPKISFIVKGEDLSPLAPQYLNMQEALKESGMTLTPTPITPELTQNAALAKPLKPTNGARMAPHGGSPEMADKVNQHVADKTGAVPHQGGFAGGVQ